MLYLKRNWPRRESNPRKTRFRKPPLYPTELRSLTVSTTESIASINKFTTLVNPEKKC